MPARGCVCGECAPSHADARAGTLAALEKHHFTCNLCDALCGLEVSVEGERVAAIRGNPDDVLSRGHVCLKAVGLQGLLEDPDRVRHPLRRTAAGFEPTSWDDAFTEIATKLRALRARHGPDAVALYVGNPVVHNHRSSLAAQLLTTALGTKNRFDPNSQDSNPRLFACMHVYGDPLCIPVPDIDRCAHLLVLGQPRGVQRQPDGSWRRPRALARSARARRARGARRPASIGVRSVRRRAPLHPSRR